MVIFQVSDFYWNCKPVQKLGHCYLSGSSWRSMRTKNLDATKRCPAPQNCLEVEPQKSRQDRKHLSLPCKLCFTLKVAFCFQAESPSTASRQTQMLTLQHQPRTMKLPHMQIDAAHTLAHQHTIYIELLFLGCRPRRAAALSVQCCRQRARKLWPSAAYVMLQTWTCSSL